jgi:hypothetical protein
MRGLSSSNRNCLITNFEQLPSPKVGRLATDQGVRETVLFEMDQRNLRSVKSSKCVVGRIGHTWEDVNAVAKSRFHSKSPYRRPICVRYVETRRRSPEGRVQAITSNHTFVSPSSAEQLMSVLSSLGFGQFERFNEIVAGRADRKAR